MFRQISETAYLHYKEIYESNIQVEQFFLHVFKAFYIGIFKAYAELTRTRFFATCSLRELPGKNEPLSGPQIRKNKRKIH